MMQYSNNYPFVNAIGAPSPYYSYGVRPQFAQPSAYWGVGPAGHVNGGPPPGVFEPIGQLAAPPSSVGNFSEAVIDGADAMQDSSWTPERKLKRGHRLAQFLAQRAMATEPDTALGAASLLAQQLSGSILQSRLDKREEQNREISRKIIAAANAEPDPQKRAEILRNSPNPELRAQADYQSGGRHMRWGWY